MSDDRQLSTDITDRLCRKVDAQAVQCGTAYRSLIRFGGQPVGQSESDERAKAMSRKITCSCGKVLKLPDESTASSARCPQCNEVFYFREHAPEVEPATPATAVVPKPARFSPVERPHPRDREMMAIFPFTSLAVCLLYLMGWGSIIVGPVAGLLNASDNYALRAMLLFGGIIGGILTNCVAELLNAVSIKLR